MEGVVLYLLKNELSKKILNAKIQKILKADKLTFLFFFDRGGEGVFLNFSEQPIIYLKEGALDVTELTPDTMWEGLLSGYKVVEIYQDDWNRVYRWKLEKKDKVRFLYMEFTGRFSNLVLTEEDNKIVTALKPMGFALDSAKRIIRGGFIYSFPNFKPKYFPQDVDFEPLLSEKGVRVLDILIKNLKGIGKDTGIDILSYLGYGPAIETPLAKDDIDRITHFLIETYRKWKEFMYTPYVLYSNDEKPLRTTFFPFDRTVEYPTLSSAISLVYEHKYKTKELITLRNRYLRLVNEKIEALLKKIDQIEEEIKLAEGADMFMQKGELLKVNLSKIKKGMDKVEVVNYYKYPPEKEYVELDPELSPHENVEKYFKKYTKYKKGKEKLRDLYDRLIKELEILKELKIDIEESEDLSWIKDRLEDIGILKKEKTPITYRGEKLKIKRFVSPDGFLILVGRSAKDNEMVLKLASPNDYWLHVRDMPGSHVIIKRSGKKDVPFRTIKYAASIAAYFSKGRGSTNVGVDYTLRKYVKPIKGGGPGFVNFREEKTIYVNPYEFKENSSSNHERSS